jgi:hypothetical protein
LGEIVVLDQVRARRMPVPVAAPNPQEQIRVAADLWIADSIRSAGEILVQRLMESRTPLLPRERATAMKAAAVLFGQPSGAE